MSVYLNINRDIICIFNIYIQYHIFIQLINQSINCIHTSNGNKSRISIRVMDLKYYIDIFNHFVIWRNQELEAICHLARSRVVLHRQK